jgi:hypothetical protein
MDGTFMISDERNDGKLSVSSETWSIMPVVVAPSFYQALKCSRGRLERGGTTVKGRSYIG